MGGGGARGSVLLAEALNWTLSLSAWKGRQSSTGTWHLQSRARASTPGSH